MLADNPDDNLSDEQVKFAKTIQSSGNDLLNLINDILDLSKIEAGHVEIRPETVSLDRLVKDVRRVFEPIAQEKRLAFEVEIAPECPDAIDTDVQRLEQVLKNLLSNAFKFTEKGKVALAIRRTGDGQIAFSVTDTGIGISEEQQQSIFEAFRQADGTISRKYGGTGLGLSISRELARLLGGSISAEEPSQGRAAHSRSSFPNRTIRRRWRRARHARWPPPIPVAPAPMAAPSAPASASVRAGRRRPRQR